MNAVTEPLVVAHEHDFYAWTRRQAELVRARRLDELDLDHLPEEIESTGNEVLFAVQSYTRQALIHLLLLQFSPAVDPREHWADELDNFRDEIDQRLKGNPSLRPRMGEVLADQWPRARRRALRKLAQDRIGQLADECPFALAQVLDPDWLPPRDAAR